VQTYGLLSSGQWIDDVQDAPRLKGVRYYYTPEEAWAYYAEKGRQDLGRRFYPDECRQMQFFQHLAVEYVKKHPGDKARLAALSMQLLWQPTVFETSGRPGAKTSLDAARRIVEPAYMIVLYVLAAAGLFVAPRAFAALALLLLAYQTVCAAFFVGATRYRVAWDFILALLAAAALARLATWARRERAK
jgi:lipopolysaccharide export LptBFGC system permease protein LptF